MTSHGHERIDLKFASAQDGVAVLIAAGQLDITTAGHLTGALVRRVDEGPRALVVDLSAVGFLDAATARALLYGHAYASWHHIDFALVSSNTLTSRALRICDPDRVLKVHASQREALEAVRAPASRAAPRTD